MFLLATTMQEYTYSPSNSDAAATGIFGSFVFETDIAKESFSIQSQRPVFHSERYQFTIFGELYLPNGEILTHTNFASDFLTSYTTPSFLQKCEGEFIFVVYDSVDRLLHVINDAFGNLAIHYALTTNACTFSTSVKAFADSVSNPELDEQAVYEHLTLGHTLGDRTLYSLLKRLPVASHLVVSRDR